MTLQKELIDGTEVIYSNKETHYKDFLVCIHGGGKTIGASRFIELQERLFNENIGSVSINFRGVEGSLGSLEDDGLENRINDTIKIIDWVKDTFTYEALSLYGVSMGGYVVLGTQEKENCKGKTIIHTPAAYAKESLTVNFNEKFTNILRTPDSWRNSESFDWLKHIENPVLLIIHSEDEVIPVAISNMYKDIVSQKDNSKVLDIYGAKHSIWNDKEENKDGKEQVILKIIDCIKNL